MGIVRSLIDLCELGGLIATDPESPERYGSLEEVANVARGFYKEVTETSEPLYIVKDCSQVKCVLERAKELLIQNAGFSMLSKC
jgi:hypothetical protein